jgi:hypothetical protein
MIIRFTNKTVPSSIQEVRDNGFVGRSKDLLTGKCAIDEATSLISKQAQQDGSFKAIKEAQFILSAISKFDADEVEVKIKD